jgi:hypothetical protein
VAIDKNLYWSTCEGSALQRCNNLSSAQETSDQRERPKSVERKLVFGWRPRRPASFSVSHTDAPDALLDFAAWRNVGYDANSLLADPMFVDAASRDYRFQADSPAFRLGIHSIDTADVGLLGDAEWTDLPN